MKGGFVDGEHAQINQTRRSILAFCVYHGVAGTGLHIADCCNLVALQANITADWCVMIGQNKLRIGDG